MVLTDCERVFFVLPLVFDRDSGVLSAASLLVVSTVEGPFDRLALREECERVGTSSLDVVVVAD